MATNETPKAAAAYALYEDLPPVSRSLRRVAELLGQSRGKNRVNLSVIEDWSSKYGWVERAKRRDDERREEARRRQAEEEEEEHQRERRAVQDMNRRHAQMGVTIQAKMLKQMEALIAAKAFGSQATVLAMKFSTELERLARGEATERTEQQQSGQISITLTPQTAQQIVQETPDELAEWRKKRGLPPASEEHFR